MKLRLLILLWWLPCWAFAHFPLLPLNKGQLTPINGGACWQQMVTPAVQPFQQQQGPCIQTHLRDIENFGTTDQSFVCRFSVQRPAGEPLYLVVENTLIDTIEVWYTYQGRRVRQLLGGALPLPPDASLSSNYTLLLRTDGSRQSVQIRYRSNSVLVVPAYLADTQATDSHNLMRYATEFLFLGMLLSLAGYNLLQLVSGSSKSHGWYLLYLVNLLLFGFLYLFGYSNFLPQTLRTIVYREGYFFCAVFICTALGFIIHFIHKEWVGKGLRRLMQFLLLGSGLVALACLFVPDAVALNLLSAEGLVFPLVHICYVWAAFRRAPANLRLYFYSTLLLNFAFFWYSLALIDVISFNWLTLTYLLGAGFFAEIVLLSLSLGKRAQQDRKQKEALQAQMLHMAEQQKEKLEAEVARQTQALRTAITELEQSSEVKAKLLSIISHDLRLPFVTLNGTLDLLHLGILPAEKVREKVQHISSSIRQIALTLENLLTWSKNQQQKIRTDLQPVHPYSIIQSCLHLLQEAITGKQLEVVTEVPEGQYVVGDPFQLECIVRNILSNAIKAAPVQTTVRISLQQYGSNSWQLSIQDAGRGIDAASLQELLSSTQPLKPYSISNGLGLQICREFLVNHGSTLHYQRTENGSCFSFALQAAAANVVPARLLHSS